jgi:hypothetical protein
MNQPLPKPDENLRPNTVAIGRDGDRVTVTITCPDVVSALDLFRALADEANERGFLTIQYMSSRATIEG